MAWQRHTQSRATNARFWVFWPKPHPFTLANVQSPQHLHAIHLHPPSPIIVPHRHFTRHFQNWATNARFWFFDLNPNPSLALANTQPPDTSMPSTRTHNLPPSSHPSILCHMAEIELWMLDFGFLAQTCPLPSRWQMCSPLLPPCHPPAPTASCHCPTPSFYMAHPKLSHPSPVSGFFDPHSSLSHTCSLTTTTTLSTAPHHLSPLPSMAICSDTEPLHSVFEFL